jgi:hypothetical protein
VDIEAATRAGIKVARIPSAGTGNALSCAEHSIYLILSLLRYQVWLLGHSFSSQQMCRFMELGFYYTFFPDLVRSQVTFSFLLGCRKKWQRPLKQRGWVAQ